MSMRKVIHMVCLHTNLPDSNFLSSGYRTDNGRLIIQERDNPTRTELEDIVTSLEEAKDTVACANGMAAIVLCMELFESGDHIVCSEDLYGGSVRMFQTTGEKRGLTFTYVNTADAAATEAAIKSNTKALNN